MIYRNKKNNQLYTKLGMVMDVTNSRAGMYSVLYEPLITDIPIKYVRELNEFNEKFELIETDDIIGAAAVMVLASKL